MTLTLPIVLVGAVCSCGALVHGRDLVIPYAMSDYASTFATVPLEDVLNAMTRA
jgi:predicted GH43/DUF377 family glycosyl hydrolase